MGMLMPGLKKGATGGLCKNSSGQAIKCGCACECTATCRSGTTPSTGYILTASGIDYTSIMSGCWTAGLVSGFSWKPTATPPNPNGTFTLPVHSSTDCCDFELATTATGQVTFYNDAVCGAVFGAENIVVPAWGVALNASGNLQIVFTSQTSSRGFAMISFAYSIPVTSLIDCRSITASNQLSSLGSLYTIPGGFTRAIIGTGGSVTLTAI